MSIPKERGMSGMKSSATLINSIDRVFDAIPFDRGMDFGYCCVGEEQKITFTLHNSGNNGPLRFSFETADDNFQVTPANGNIASR
jgi:hypothetical protein